ncbi:MAG: response regulator [Spirochaetes bacterium]|nr:response regulator [Spirochaetota bacterium]
MQETTFDPPAKILIIDDDERNLYILEHKLTKEGYQLIPALSGQEALDILENESVDLILLDIIMPEMDGYDVCRKLKESDETKEVPIIFLTGQSGLNNMIKAFDIGAVDYIIKPFRKEELLARVKIHIELKRSRDELKKALAEIKTLQGLIPICANCKNVKNKDGSWDKIEQYIKDNSLAEFSHTLCDDCLKELYGIDYYKRIKKLHDQTN